MIEMPARVTRVDGLTAWVHVEAPSSCGACGGKGCGSSLYARMLHPGEPEYPVDNPIDAAPGETVVVGLPDGALYKAVLAGYGLPLLLLIAGAMLGARFGEIQAVLGAVAGFSVAALWLRRRRQADRPVVLRRGVPACQTH